MGCKLIIACMHYEIWRSCAGSPQRSSSLSTAHTLTINSLVLHQRPVIISPQFMSCDINLSNRANTSESFARTSVIFSLVYQHEGHFNFPWIWTSPESRRFFREALIIGVIATVYHGVAALSFRAVARSPYKIYATTYVRSPGRPEYNSRWPRHRVERNE